MLKSGRSATSGKSVPEPQRVYLDANAFIYALEGTPEVAEPAQLLISELGRSRAAITSELTLAEVLVKPERLRLFKLKREYLNLLVFTRAIRLVGVSRTILQKSAQYRGRVHPEKPDRGENKRNFLPDAIHVATAIEAGVGFFVARDTRLRLPREMPRVAPDMAGVRDLLGKLA